MNDIAMWRAEVNRHVEWVRRDGGATPQRCNTPYGSAEVCFLAYGWMLTLLAGDDEGVDDDGTWFWASDPDGLEVFEFTIPYGGHPTPEQRQMVDAFTVNHTTDLPHRLDEESTW